MPWTTGGLLEAVLALLTIGATLWKIGPWTAARLTAWAESRRRRSLEWARIVSSVDTLVRDFREVKHELQANGGSSVKDAVVELRADMALERTARRAAWGQAAYELRILPDGSTRTLYVTPTWTALTGLTREESERDGWARAVHPDDRERVIDSSRAAIAARTVFAEEYVVRNVRTAREVEVEHIGTPVVDGRGHVVGWVGVVTPLDDGRAVRLTQVLRAASE